MKEQGCRTREDHRGFTLVELVVVVVIIGLLVGLAFPTFKKNVYRTRSTEAKLKLGGVWSAEMAFKTEYDTFASCINTMGVDDGLSGFYAIVGLDSCAPVSCNQLARDKGAVCPDDGGTPVAGIHKFPATKSPGGCLLAGTAATYDTADMAVVADPLTLSVSVIGNVAARDCNGTLDIVGTDRWKMDKSKKIDHYREGW
jgi:prepilin-type N-terminal cleavage/methylation domain-containing protein